MPSSLVVITGQSNATGLEPCLSAGAMQINTQVKSWQPSDGSQYTPPYAFFVCDPQRSFTYINFLPLFGTVGGYRTAGLYFGNPVGHMGWACANFAQQQEQNTMYMVSICQGAAGISQWGDGELIEELLATEIPLAIAAIEAETGDVLDRPDLVIWMQGETNATDSLGQYMPGAAYA